MSSPNLQEFTITPQGESTFEQVVRRLHLSSEEYASSFCTQRMGAQAQGRKTRAAAAPGPHSHTPPGPRMFRVARNFLQSPFPRGYTAE